MMVAGQRDSIAAGCVVVLSLAGLGAGRSAAQDQPPASAPATAALVRGNTAFALELYARLRDTPGNLVFSPFSTTAALALTYAGARGDTARQMAEVLYFGPDADRVHAAFAALRGTASTPGEDADSVLFVANALWKQRGERLLDTYLQVTRDSYGATLQELDFVAATEAARQAINTWVAEHTQQRIKELLKPGDVDPATVLVLTNAIYFKGQWERRFDPQQTRDEAFHVDPGRPVDVPMMHQSDTFRWAGHDVLDVLELPYAGDRWAMVILLPKRVDGLAAVEAALNPVSLERWLTGLREESLRVTLPRFQAHTRFDLTRILQRLGMTDAFDPHRADFSGIDGGRELYLSLVVHEADIVVNEEGTEAAAATGVVMKRTSLPPEFRADHPFLYLIRDTQTGSVLFIGRVVDPSRA